MMRKHTDKIKELECRLEILIRRELPKPCPDSSPLFILPFHGMVNTEATRGWKLVKRRGKWHMLSSKEEIDYILTAAKATDEQRAWLWDNLPIKKKKKDFEWKKSPWKLIDDIMKCLDDLIQKRWKKLHDKGWTNHYYDTSEIREVEDYQIRHKLMDERLSDSDLARWEEYFNTHHVLDLKLSEVTELMAIYSDILRLRKDDMTLRELIDYATEDKKDPRIKKPTKTIYQVMGKTGKKKKEPSFDTETKKDKTRENDLSNDLIIKDIYSRYGVEVKTQTLSEYFAEIQNNYF